MGLEGGSEGVVTAAELNEAAYREALAGSPPLFRDTFLKRGKQLQFGADRWAGGCWCGGAWMGSCDHPACMSIAAELLQRRSCQPCRLPRQPAAQARSPQRCRDVSREIKSPVDWMHMPPSFEAEPGAACLLNSSPSCWLPVAAWQQ